MRCSGLEKPTLATCSSEEHERSMPACFGNRHRGKTRHHTCVGDGQNLPVCGAVSLCSKQRERDQVTRFKSEPTLSQRGKGGEKIQNKDYSSVRIPKYFYIVKRKRDIYFDFRKTFLFLSKSLDKRVTKILCQTEEKPRKRGCSWLTTVLS
jgi:hypothetical protein